MPYGDQGGADRESVGVAPVIPLFGRTTDERSLREESPSERHPAHGRLRRAEGPEATGAEAETRRPVLRAVEPVGAGVAEFRVEDPVRPIEPEPDPEPAERREAAERVLLRKLRAKALSVSEARLLLRGEGLAEADADEIIDDCLRRGYLDDRVLAELLVRAGVERRNQGRAALARSLAQRGLDRHLVDEALAELPDDDAERALEYARGKARSLMRLDADTALRRLVGQLARRGFGGSVAMGAAKQALREASGRSATGVRFRDAD